MIPSRIMLENNILFYGHGLGFLEKTSGVYLWHLLSITHA